MLIPITIKGTQCQILDKRASCEGFDIPTFSVSPTGKVSCFGKVNVCLACQFSFRATGGISCGAVVYNDIKLNFPELFV